MRDELGLIHRKANLIWWQHFRRTSPVLKAAVQQALRKFVGTTNQKLVWGRMNSLCSWLELAEGLRGAGKRYKFRWPYFSSASLWASA